MIEQAGCVPYRPTADGYEILLITTRKGKWTIPKGIIDLGETPEETAAKEAFEEAGVRGQIESGSIGAFEYHKWDDELTVQVFLLRVRVQRAVVATVGDKVTVHVFRLALVRVAIVVAVLAGALLDVAEVMDPIRLTVAICSWWSQGVIILACVRGQGHGGPDIQGHSEAVEPGAQVGAGGGDAGGYG